MKGRITTVKKAKPGSTPSRGCGSGYGFIKDERSVDRFFHANGVDEGVDFEDLQEGLDVEFEPYEEPGRGARARKVRLTTTS